MWMILLLLLYSFRSQTKFYQSEGSKQAARTSAHHNDLLSIRHIRISCRHILVMLRLFVDVDAHLQIDKDGTLAGIDASTQNAK